VCCPFAKNQQTSAINSLKAQCAQALQTAGQSHGLRAPIEMIAKSQALQTAGQSHVLQALVKMTAKSQALQSAGQSDALWLKQMPTVKLCKLQGKVTFSRL